MFKSLYIHLPFCLSRCIYCGFYSTTSLDLQQDYVDALIKELSMYYGKPERWATVYLGGGTPSTLTARLLDRLLGAIGNVEADAEITMECNPDDITPEFAQWIATSPINRVSMGAQTFDNNRLKWLHRRHTSEQVDNAVKLLRDNGINNISIDLMFGFPEETMESWRADIQHALTLRPEHISAYSLMYEEGTALYNRLTSGRVEEIDEELSVGMYDTLVSMMVEAGYEHYEISNFAQRGYRARHNSNYWNQTPYLGIGAAAHSYDARLRWWNVSDISRYIRSIAAGTLPRECEEIDERTRYNDIITTALRTSDGIPLDTLSASQQAYIMQQAAPHLSHHRLAVTDRRLHLTRQGIYTSDDIMSDLIMV